MEDHDEHSTVHTLYIGQHQTVIPYEDCSSVGYMTMDMEMEMGMDGYGPDMETDQYG